MSINSPNIKDREFSKFVESPTRPGQAALEVVGALTVVDGSGFRSQVLGADDLEINYTWIDFGTKNERVSQIIYTAASVSGVTIQRGFTYSLVSGKYKLDSEEWSVV